MSDKGNLLITYLRAENRDISDILLNSKNETRMKHDLQMIAEKWKEQGFIRRYVIADNELISERVTGRGKVTFLDIPLTREEELFLTSVVIELADGQKLSDADILHRLIEKAEGDNVLTILKRELRKQKATIQKGRDGRFKNEDYAKGFMECLAIVNELIGKNL